MYKHYVTMSVFLMVFAIIPATAQQTAIVLDFPLQVTPQVGSDRLEKVYTFASELHSYTLNADYSLVPGEPGKVSSHWWAWTTGLIPIGMTSPSSANWYYQAFFNWTFDEMSLHDREFTYEVVREIGQDAMIKYTWDTEKVTATMRFAIVAGSDKLLVFAEYEPKEPIEKSELLFSCYPSGFDQPRSRAITTAKGTRRTSPAITLDLAEERWVLYEDIVENRRPPGPSAMLIGTPQNINRFMVSGEYAIETVIEMHPEARSVALALYEFPALPENDLTREYFQATGDAQAQALGEMAAGNLDAPLPLLPMQDYRLDQISGIAEDMFQRPAETWRPNPDPLNFAWARDLPGEPIRTALLVPRYSALETMELARRLPMDVVHIYADNNDNLVANRAWPYQNNTGVGPLPLGAVNVKAAAMTDDETVEVFMFASLDGVAVPPLMRRNVVRQVAAGKGLLLTGNDSVRNEWPEELFANRDEAAEARILASFDWTNMPGLRDGDIGRLPGSPVQVYNYGEGRVVAFRSNIHRYSSIVPRTNDVEGLVGLMDRSLAICARAALYAAGREPAVQVTVGEVAADGRSLVLNITPQAPADSTLTVRVQDEFEHVLGEMTLPLPPADGRVALPRVPAGVQAYADLVVANAQGQALGFAFTALPVTQEAAIDTVAFAPAVRNHPLSPYQVDLPEGGAMTCSAQVTLPAGAAAPQLVFEVRDINERIMARQVVAVPAGGGEVSATLDITRPVVVSHILDISLLSGDDTLAFTRERFTLNPPFPLDDFTVLMWTFIDAPPALQYSDRMCYEWGTDMMDMYYMSGLSHERSAREYDLSSRSGLRLLPYITRIAGSVDDQHQRLPGLRDTEYIDSVSNNLRTTCRQAEAYNPVAYTLGDENYLFRGEGEVCHRPESIEAFRVWLQEKYGSIAGLNDAWATNYGSFAEITPMLLEQAAEHPASFAPWVDHKRFMDDEFTLAHERFADVIHEVDPGAIVGWDGHLNYSWRAGYDFEKMSANLLLNQTYTTNWPQGEYVRSFKQEGALTGMWGNSTADVEEGWRAHPWACLFQEDNSVWWWMSWGIDYTPFNPDGSQSSYGEWFFDEAAKVKAGPGKLLLEGKRDARVAVLYNQRDVFAQTIIEAMNDSAALAGDRNMLSNYAATFRGIMDYGTQFENVSQGQVEAGVLTERDYDILWLARATSLSDETVSAIEQFVTNGGTLVVDGGAGLLDGNGKLRDTRPLDALLGVTGATGIEALTVAPQRATLDISGSLGGAELDLSDVAVSIFEPALRTTTGEALATAGETPLLIVNTVGQGQTITLNMALSSFTDERRNPEPGPIGRIFAAVLEAAGVPPYAALVSAEGNPGHCLWQARFDSGGASYLMIQEDFEIRGKGLGEQKLQLTLPQPAVVYDIISGSQVGEGQVQSWEISVKRGSPALFALLPYEVTGLNAQIADSAALGQSVPVEVSVAVDGGEAGFHVVRLDVFAPGSDTPHRQYSQNIGCTGGQGVGDIPLALNDTPGQWRLELRDVASGTRVIRTLTVQ